MNKTFEMLAEHAHLPKTQRLVSKMEKLLVGQDGAVVMAALVQVLVFAHLGLNADEDGDNCRPCSNAVLTELLQTIRAVNDEILDDEDEDEK